ncbi:MAG TPA: hypothetical protein VGO86_19715, partial [Candidatus Dormibacteraeota bacterium]
MKMARTGAFVRGKEHKRPFAEIRYTPPSTLRTEDGALAVRLPNPAAGKGARVVVTSRWAPWRAITKLAIEAPEELNPTVAASAAETLNGRQGGRAI